jgi:CubicO group peptidase (beta-lactamase class C family)
MFRTLRGIPLLGCLLGTLGCQGQPSAPPPIQKGDYGAIIRYLQSRIPREMARDNVAGLSIALVSGQELIWARGFGLADKARGVPVTPNTAFRAGGISTLLTATAALQLVEQQRLGLDAPLQRTLREFHVRSRFHSDQAEADQAITLRRLLSHQSGLPSEHLRDLRSNYAMGQMPQRVSGVWLSSPPGSQVAYSNLGYALVGAAIERSTGKSFEAQLQGSLLRPLEMNQSSFVGTGTQLSYRALGYEEGKASNDAQVRDLAATSLWASPKDLSHYRCCSPKGSTRATGYWAALRSMRCSPSRTPAMPWISIARWASAGFWRRAGMNRLALAYGPISTVAAAMISPRS